MSESGSASGAKSRSDIIRDMFSDLDEGKKVIADRIIDEMEYLENKMDELRELPFIEMNTHGEQRASPASKIYKDCLAQYSNNVRMLLNMTGKQGEDRKDSPLRAYFRELAKDV